MSLVAPTISALCGSLTPLEVPLAMAAIRQAIIWRHPWLTRLNELNMPTWMAKRSSCVWEWAWLDKQEQKFGSVYWMEPLPKDWRRLVKLTSFRASAHRQDGTSYVVGFWDLPSDYQAYLGGLGYDTTP